MELKLDNVSTKNLKNINIIFKNKIITSILGDHDSGVRELINVLTQKEKITNGSILLENSNQIIENEIYYLGENYENKLFNINIGEDIKFYLGNYDKEKLKELLKQFNLDIKILKKSYLELSSSEIRKIVLIIGLLIDSKIIIIENPTIKLDNNSLQTLIKNLKKEKRENKIIIITSTNSQFVLEVSDNVVCMNNNKIIFNGNEFEVLSNIELLDKVKLNIPNALCFSNKVKELKNKKIGYRDNINDLVKDIFRHAK